MESPRDDQLIADLRALRPAPHPEFAAELDQRAAAGFPRRSRLRWPQFAPLRVLPRRRLLLSAGGVMVVAIAVATALVASNSGESSHVNIALSPHPAKPESRSAPKNFDGAGAYVRPSKSSAGDSAGSAEESGVQYESEVPVVPSSAANASLKPFSRTVHPRFVERAAEVVLGAEPADVAGDATKVFEAVHASDGIVMRSSTHQGKAGRTGATFELLIPSAKLGGALAAFSAIDTVRSRHEATANITHPTVTTAELLQESRARIDGLLGQLGEAETESEREAIEAELRHEHRHAARLAAQLDHLHKRADYSRVSLRIVTGEAEESGGGAWGIGDAFHDAGHILAVAAAVTVVALAILGPIALIALLAWLTHRAWVRRERRRVLS